MEQLHLLTLNMLQKMDKRLTLLEDRLLPSSVEPPAQVGFPQFAKLPPEIRRMIWDTSIPSRKFRPFDYREEDTDHTKFSLLPPVAAQVCRESRGVACVSGGMYLMYWEPTSRYTSFEYWTWFDGSHDVLELHLDCVHKIGKRKLKGLKKMLRRAKSILVTIPDMLEPEGWIDLLFKDQEVRRTLTTIYVQRSHPDIAHYFRWHPNAIAKLFKDRSFYLLDLEDKQDVEHVRKIQSLNPEGAERWFNKWLEVWEEHEKDMSIPLTTAWARKTFTDAWVFRGNRKIKKRYFRSIAAIIDKKDPWIKERLAGMPRVRPVYTMEKSTEARSFLDPLTGIPIHPLLDNRFWQVGGLDDDAALDGSE